MKAGGRVEAAQNWRLFAIDIYKKRSHSSCVACEAQSSCTRIAAVVEVRARRAGEERADLLGRGRSFRDELAGWWRWQQLLLILQRGRRRQRALFVEEVSSR